MWRGGWQRLPLVPHMLNTHTYRETCARGTAGHTLGPPCHPSTCAGLAVAVPGLWGHSRGSPGCMDGMEETTPPSELCWLGGGGENDDGMVLTRGGWRPSGRAPASPQDSPLGGMLVSWLEKTLWPQQQGFGSNPKLLVRTVRGQGAGERGPTGFCREQSAWQH